jgi:hypothetical protein
MPLTQVQGGMILPSTTLTTPIVATTMGVGGATPAASGSGITFPATQSASSDANTLDDYEEGTWTPTVGGTSTYSSASGQYVKIGRLVVVTFDMTINQVGTGNTTVVFGLPFTAAGNSQGQTGGVGFFASLATAANYIALRIDIGATSINSAITTGSQTTISNSVAIFGNSTRLIATLSYQV